ncbi:MAG: ankyrin repeat domain-containing protein, partial [Candidatus Micrarchaeota archaeon]|nr:ankyrin repeat domain-containing protein [Candidatus Micrarchaeota archaeon]
MMANNNTKIPSQNSCNGSGISDVNRSSAFQAIAPLAGDKAGPLKEQLFLGIRNACEQQVMLALKSGANANWCDENGTPALIFAIREGSLPIIRLLVENGANPDTIHNDETALMLSAGLRGSEVAALLLRHGANPSLKGIQGFTSLSYAITFGNEDMVRLLVENGADVNSRSVIGMTPLALALSGRKVSIAQYLLTKGADPALADNLGITPLMRAAVIPEELGPAVLIKELISRGADVNARDNDGKTAYYYARRHKRLSNARLL